MNLSNTYQFQDQAIWFLSRSYLKIFYQKSAWLPFWSCDSDAFNKLTFPRLIYDLKQISVNKNVQFEKNLDSISHLKTFSNLDIRITDKELSNYLAIRNLNQRTSGPVNAHLISWPSKAKKNIQNLENIW